MARRRKQAVRKYHDRVARRYDASYDDAYWRFHDTLTWDYLKPFLPADQSVPVLDLGCGTGKWALRLIQSGFHVSCVDISGAMVAQARRKVDEIGRLDRAEFYQADLADLSALPARSYGLAVAMGDPIGCTDPPARALKEIRKRLREGGVLVATLDNKLAALDYYLQTRSVEKMKSFLKTGRTHWLTRSEEEQFEIHTYTPSEAERLFQAAGFEVIDLRGKTVLDLRHHRELVDDAESRRAWLRIEKSLGNDRHAIGRASHLQIAARSLR